MKQKFTISADLTEELSSVPLDLQGNIPKWLSGTLVRNGPVSVAVNGKSTGHWFDGLAMLHAFAFDNGRVSYTNKFLRTESYNTVFNEGSVHYAGFATEPSSSLFKKFFTWFAPRTNLPLPNANVNVAEIAQEYVALTEVPLPIRFDKTTLNTLGTLDYEDALPKEKCWECAHPHRDNQGTFNYLIQYGRTSHYILYYVPDNQCRRHVICKIPVDEPAYMHSFAMTDHYIIFAEFPFVMNPLDLLTQSKAFIYNFQWKPERGTRFTVVDKQTGEIVSVFHTKAFFAFHHVNAYEKEESIYLDMICYDHPSITLDVAHYFKTKNPEHAQLKMRLDRFVLSLFTQQLTTQTFLEAPLEFPSINSSFNGKPYRYVYLTDTRDRTSPDDLRPLIKCDLENQQRLEWAEKGCYPGEPLFVVNPETLQEDEGVLLSVVLQPDNNSSFLLVLDAASFQELGRTTIPHFIPPGLHGHFFNS